MDRGAWWAIDYGVAKRVRHDLMTKQEMDYNLKNCIKIKMNKTKNIFIFKTKNIVLNFLMKD